MVSSVNPSPSQWGQMGWLAVSQEQARNPRTRSSCHVARLRLCLRFCRASRWHSSLRTTRSETFSQDPRSEPDMGSRPRTPSYDRSALVNLTLSPWKGDPYRHGRRSAHIHVLARPRTVCGDRAQLSRNSLCLLCLCSRHVDAKRLALTMHSQRSSRCRHKQNLGCLRTAHVGLRVATCCGSRVHVLSTSSLAKSHAETWASSTTWPESRWCPPPGTSSFVTIIHAPGKFAQWSGVEADTGFTRCD